MFKVVEFEGDKFQRRGCDRMFQYSDKPTSREILKKHVLRVPERSVLAPSTQPRRVLHPGEREGRRVRGCAGGHGAFPGGRRAGLCGFTYYMGGARSGITLIFPQCSQTTEER